MSRYRTIHCLIWSDDKFPFLSDDAQLVFFHLLTTPMSSQFGCFKAGVAALAEEKRWDYERYKKAFREVFQEGFTEYDERHRVVFLKSFLKYNPPTSPNVVRGYAAVFSELPACATKDNALMAIKSWCDGASKGFQEAFQEAFGKAFAKAMANKEQEQEQEQDTGEKNVSAPTEAETPPPVKKSGSTSEKPKPKNQDRVSDVDPTDGMPPPTNSLTGREKPQDRVSDVDPTDGMPPPTNSLTGREKPQVLGPKYTPEDFALAEAMADSLADQYPSQKTDLPAWANCLRMMREIDGLALGDIESLWTWCRHDEFWRGNIRAPTKFRQRKDGVTYWDILRTQFQRSVQRLTGGVSGNSPPGNRSTRDRTLHEDLTDDSWAHKTDTPPPNHDWVGGYIEGH